MATATRETKSVEKIETVEEKVVILTLTEDEAKTLKSLIFRADGDVRTSYNKHLRDIRFALDDANLMSFGNRFSPGRITAYALPLDPF